jgi:hypothetical protein
LSNFDIQEVNLQGVDLSEAILPALAQMPLLGTFIAGRWHILRVSGGKGKQDDKVVAALGGRSSDGCPGTSRIANRWSGKMVDYTVIAEDTWDLLAPVKESDPWEPLMMDLSEGKIVCLPYSDPRDRRAKRLSIARRAATRGFKTEARYTYSELAVRRVDGPSPPAQAKPRQRRRKVPDE